MKTQIALASLLLQTGCGSLFYYPDRHVHFQPEEHGFHPKDVSFSASDSTDLTGWYFSPAVPTTKQVPRGTIIQFHGNAENMTSHFASLAWVTREGYELFSFDYRGYGRSSGSPDAEGTYRDGLAALDQALKIQRQSGSPCLIVYGESLGGMVAMRSFADWAHQQEVALLVMDSTFSSYKDMVQEKLAGFFVTWAFSPLGRGLVSDEYASEHYIPRIKAPVLVIHDKSDPIVGFENGKKIYSLVQSPKEFWEFDQGRHVGTYSPDTPENRKRLLERLEQVCARR